jgi:hypothetical protein
MAVSTKRKNVSNSNSKSKTSSKSNKVSRSRKHLIKSRKSRTKTRKMRGGNWMKALKTKFSRAKAVAPVPVVPKTPISTPKETMAAFNARMRSGVPKTPTEKRQASMATAVKRAENHKQLRVSNSTRTSIRNVLDVSGINAQKLGNHFEH